MLQLYINFPADEHVMIYIDTATLYHLSCTRTRDNISIRLLDIYFSADEHVIIYTYKTYISFPVDEHLKIYAGRNYILRFMQMNT